MPIQQMLLGVGAVATKTYVDDIFSTYVYTGTGSARSINTGIDMTEGGLVWIKDRSAAYNHSIQDTVRGAGATKKLSSNLSNAENSGDTANHWAGYISSFNNNGFSIDKTGSGAIDWANYNKSGDDYTSWTFRKAPGFFTIKEYTGSGSTQSLTHDLGCVPGMIIVKCTSASEMWGVYHRGQNGGVDPWNYRLKLDSTGAEADATFFGDTAPTATHFTVGDSHGEVNTNGATYIAYLFAGGESTAATARSVDFDGSNDKLSLAASDDFHLTGDFTIEGWFYPTGSSNEHFWSIGQYGNTGGILFYIYDNKLYVQESGSDRMLMDPAPPQKQWSHIALVRSGSTINLYINGTSVKNWTYSNDYGSSSEKEFYIGGSYAMVGDVNISNLRVVKGTAVYTSSFRPPTEPLTNITNTKLLCCNNSSVTGKTVGGTITASGNPTASTDSPFDDPAGFKFGEAGDQNVIKCGSYVGSGSAGLEVNLGWEPQWVLIKNASAAKSWKLLDSMRGIVTGDMEAEMQAENTNAEHTGADRIDLTSTGFKLKTTSPIYNADGDTYTFMCLRRSDGYVGKPAEAGTDVFNVIAGTSGDPTFKLGFVTDFVTSRPAASSSSWWTYSRLTGTNYLALNSTDAEGAGGSSKRLDFMNGFVTGGGTSDTAWGWKRHAGFTTLAYKGNGVAGRQIAHDMNKTVEMIWLKNRSSGSYNWMCYHKGLNGGTSPEDYFLRLNTTDAEASSSTYLNSTAPTSTHITLGSINAINADGNNFIAMLFASVEGISKCGFYNGSNSDQTITLGFQPRLFICKARDEGSSDYKWTVLDSTRGLVGSSGKALFLNASESPNENHWVTSVSSTGITLKGIKSHTNFSGREYIYYAHA